MAGRTAYRFLPPFFFPPLAAFFAIALYPPLRVGFDSEEQSPYRSASANRHAGGASIRRSFASAENLDAKKLGEQSVTLSPPGPVGGG